MGLRTDQVELTRRKIIDTVLRLSTKASNAGPVTVSEVARRSGVSPATIYRHFPTRDALIQAAASERTLLGVPPGADSYGPDEGRAHLLALWRELEEQIVLLRQVAASEAWRELRRARFAVFAEAVEEALVAAGADPRAADVQRAMACAHALESSLAFLDFHDRQGLDADAAVEAARFGSEALLRAVGIEPDEFRIPIPALSERTRSPDPATPATHHQGEP